MNNMKNVTLFTLMSTVKIGLSNNYNCYINRPIYNPMTILPDVNNIASKCFLKKSFPMFRNIIIFDFNVLCA